MNLIRFLGHFFIFICLLAGCTIVIGILALAIRLWPILLILTMAFVLFHWLLRRIGTQINLPN
ncbi:hypothetical protein HB13667_01110 [Pseudomonas putida]|jgi:hypothetical protein|uniref:Lipoprotein n=1 Tax=Pseudomonas putida TaxID=303 RepID=A0A0P7CKI7_PSEPU|nr:hypothetical protein HB13667_01110 [Pseudomonas putida]KXK67824.1 hypothetical protein BC89_29105 [Pseudomonas monteilii]RNF79170.1 hypothetical protein EFK07_28660 [Pseudomonas putida]